MLNQLKEHFKTLTYDKNYQNIEVLGHIGYDDSEPSWLKIESLLSDIDLSDKTVCDLGCFHGYFSLKVKSLGASKVIGLDKSDLILETAKLIAQCSDVEIDFRQWEGGEPTPECHLAFVLNMLHHCDNELETLKNINCQFAVFEINQDQITTIDKVFTMLNIVEGRSYPDRPNRLLILAQKKVNLQTQH